MDARLFVEFSAHKAHPCRRRSGRARPQLSAGPRHPRRRPHLPAPAARRAGAPRRQTEHQGMARRHRQVARRVGNIRSAEFRHSRLADAARTRGRRLPGGAAAGRHHLLRRRRQS